MNRLRRMPASCRSPSAIMSSTPATDVGCMGRNFAVDITECGCTQHDFIIDIDNKFVYETLRICVFNAFANASRNVINCHLLVVVYEIDIVTGHAPDLSAHCHIELAVGGRLYPHPVILHTTQHNSIHTQSSCTPHNTALSTPSHPAHHTTQLLTMNHVYN
jgi:hypothetical protein